MPVDTFETTQNTYRFQIDGNDYELPTPGWAEYESALHAISEGSANDQFEFATTLLRQKTDAATLKAIEALSISQLSTLFTGWLGHSVGESSSSPR